MDDDKRRRQKGRAVDHDIIPQKVSSKVHALFLIFPAVFDLVIAEAGHNPEPRLASYK